MCTWVIYSSLPVCVGWSDWLTWHSMIFKVNLHLAFLGFCKESFAGEKKQVQGL